MARRARRTLSLTPLIDVIFLLLLFFMLTTSFAPELELPLAPAGLGAAEAARPAFLDLGPAALVLNGASLSPDDLPSALAGEGAVVVRVAPGVTAQRLIDVLGPLARVPGLAVQVLG